MTPKSIQALDIRSIHRIKPVVPGKNCDFAIMLDDLGRGHYTSADYEQFYRRHLVANTKSAKKAIKVQERRRARNQWVKARVRTSFKKASAALSGEGDAAAEVKDAISEIDKAVAKGVIHKNTAARKKSRLMKKLNAN